MWQVKEEGYEVDHGGNCITVFSAPNYVDQVATRSFVNVFAVAVAEHQPALAPAPGRAHVQSDTRCVACHN